MWLIPILSLSGSKNVYLFPTWVNSYDQFWNARMLRGQENVSNSATIVVLRQEQATSQIWANHHFNMQSRYFSTNSSLNIIILAHCRATSFLKRFRDPCSWPFGCHPSRWPRGSGLHARRGTAGWEERPEAGSRMHPCRHRRRAPSTLFYLREAQKKKPAASYKVIV